jgi:hypothetical protein
VGAGVGEWPAGQRQRAGAHEVAGGQGGVAGSGAAAHALQALLLLDKRVLPARQFLHAAAHVGRKPASHLGEGRNWQL